MFAWRCWACWPMGSGRGRRQPPPAQRRGWRKPGATSTSATRYAFAADVVIKTIPLPTAGKIGRFSKTDSLYLEGTNDLKGQGLEMALWGGGVSVANRDAAYQVRIRDGRTETRAGDGAWQSGEDGAASFAPSGDFLAFLDVAKNVTLADDGASTNRDIACTGPNCAELTRYTFDLNSRAYAERLRSISEQQMIRGGMLPPGASATPRAPGQHQRVGRAVGGCPRSTRPPKGDDGDPRSRRGRLPHRDRDGHPLHWLQGLPGATGRGPLVGVAGRPARCAWIGRPPPRRARISASSRCSWWAPSWRPAPAAAPDLSSPSWQCSPS